MSKYNGDNPFVQLSRSIFHEDCKLSYKAKWLYTVLSELEHRYTGNEEDFFFRPQDKLKNDCGMDLRTVRSARKELIKSGYLHTYQMHWVDKKTGKRSEKHVTAYKILK